MEQWLVRSEDNWITGPYSKEQIQQMVLNRQLKSPDEVCSAHGYWISIHEVSEVKQQLGIDVPSSLEEDGETTTQVQRISALNDDRTDPDLRRSTDELSQDGVTSVFKFLPKEGIQTSPKRSPQLHSLSQARMPLQGNVKGVVTVGVKTHSHKSFWIFSIFIGLVCAGFFLKSKGFFK